MKIKFTIAAPVIAILSVFIMGIMALMVVNQAESSRKLPHLGEVKAFEFVQGNGNVFGTTQMTGKINIVDFFFTSCRGPCPMMSAAMKELYNFYQSEEKIQFVSVSVDPQTDSLVVLQQYAHKIGVHDNRWVFLRADIEKVKWLSEKVFMLASELPDLHSTKFILVDHKNNIRGYYDPFSEESLRLLKSHIKELGKEL